MMIDPFKIPPEQLKDVFEESLIGLAKKVNEIIDVLNQPDQESSFETDILDLIDTWKNEARQLEQHPVMFQGFSREVCTAIARDKIHCCSELLKLIEEQ